MKNPFIEKAILYTMDGTRGERGVCATPLWSFSEFLPGRLTISTFQELCPFIPHAHFRTEPFNDDQLLW